MLPFLTEHHGNPSAANAPGRRARLALDEARDQVAHCLGCLQARSCSAQAGPRRPTWPYRGSWRLCKAVPLCSAIEHPSVLKPALSVAGRTVRVAANGVLDLDALESALDPGVALVAVMLANNEIGTVQPVLQVTELVRRLSPGALILVDAVHAVGWLDVAELCAGADMLAVSAHKFGGPKGAGALVVRAGTSWVPSGLGGAQERERRPGTENVAGISGMAAALGAATEERTQLVARISTMRDRLADSICSAVTGVTETGVNRVERRPAADRTGRARSRAAATCS